MTRTAQHYRTPLAFAFVTTVALVQITTFFVDGIQVLGLPLCIGTAWLLGRLSAPWLLEQQNGWQRLLIGGLVGAGAYALSNSLLNVLLFVLYAPENFSFTRFLFDDVFFPTPLLRWLLFIPVAGLLGAVVGSIPFSRLHKLGDTSERSAKTPSTEIGTKVVRLTPFLGKYTLYTFVSGMVFILLASTIDEYGYYIFFEAVGLAWVQCAVALVAWLVKFGRKIGEVTLSSGGLRIFVWTLGGLQASYALLVLLTWAEIGMWNLISGTGIVVRFLYYAANVALVIFLFRSSSSKLDTPTSPR